jgi:hypothetical protein
MDKDPQRRTATARAFADALGVAAAPLRRISRRDHRGSCH